MSHGKTHHHLGDSGASQSSNNKSELSAHNHSSHNPTFRALHSEATGSLSGPSSDHHVARHISSSHHDRISHSIPAVKGAESVQISAKSEKASSAKSDSTIHVPKLSIISEAQSKPLAAFALNKLVPPHLLDASEKSSEKTVQRTSQGEANAGDLFQARSQEQKQDQTKADQTKDLKITPLIGNFDLNKKIADMVQAGSIVDRSSMVSDNSEKAKLAPGEVPSIKVAYASADADGKESTRPDFLIKKDGSVEMYSNPQVTGQKEIVVQFERDGENFALTDAQKAAGGKFYTYLQAQLKAQFPQAASDAFKVEDSQGLLRDTDLPPEVKKNLAEKPQINPSSGLPENAGPTIQDTNRISRGGSSSRVPRGDIDNMTPPAQRLANESERVAAMKDTVASYVTRGEKKPYDYVAKRGDRGWGVGRYGMTYNQVSRWLEGLSDEQIEELIKQGKLSPAQAKNLKKMRDSIKHSKETGNENDLDPFLKKMKDGSGTEEEMRAGVQEMLPDKVQELAATDTIARISKELRPEAQAAGEDGVDPGQVALSFVLGRNVTRDEYNKNPDYKQFVDSARQAYRMQEQARIQGGAIINVENMSQVADALNKMVGMQFWREAAGPTEYGNKGCAIAVTRALQRMGVQIGMHLDVTGTAVDMRRRGWQEVSLAQAMRSGQLYVPVNKETGSHIGIGIGNQVWENSSGQRQFVTRNINNSSLRNSGRAFIVPIQVADKSSSDSSNRVG